MTAAKFIFLNVQIMLPVARSQTLVSEKGSTVDVTVNVDVGVKIGVEVKVGV